MLELREDGAAVIHTRQGRSSVAQVLGSSFVSPILAILDLRVTDGRLRRAVPVAFDSLQRDDFRRLRVWLRWQRAPTNTNLDSK
jgi:hypothetical protein